VAYITRIEDLPYLKEEEKHALITVADKFAFRSNDYYNSLINWEDPKDPLRKIVIPDAKELFDWGEKDPSNEKSYTVAPGIQHKYRQTALIMVNDVCGAFCRFCFRKRLFMNGGEVSRDISQGLEYIRKHKEITNILLSGGDPLLLSTNRLEEILRQLRKIDHVQIIRIGTKIPAFYPFRIIEDPALPEIIKKYSSEEKKIYFVVQFNHPREITRESVEAIRLLQQAEALIVSQTPLLIGVNDDPETLAQLFKKLSFIGVSPYYVFQCRPTVGNHHFVVPVEEGYWMVETAKSRCSGLAKRAKFVMSHSTGKIEVVGVTKDCVYMKYQQAANPRNIGMFMAYKRNPYACWYDDYSEWVNYQRIEQQEAGLFSVDKVPDALGDDRIYGKREVGAIVLSGQLGQTSACDANNDEI
jgi:lysine 2,3-aminomutase